MNWRLEGTYWLRDVDEFIVHNANGPDTSAFAVIFSLADRRPLFAPFTLQNGLFSLIFELFVF